MLDLGDEDDVGRFRNDFGEVFEAERQLVDAHHALAGAKAHSTQSIANESAGRIFLRRMDRILKVENDGVGPMEASVDCVLGLGAGKIEARAAQAIFGRRCGRRDFLRQSFVAVGEPGPADGSLDAGRNHVGQCTFIVDGNFRVLYAQRFEHVTSLRKNRLSIIRADAGFEAEFDAARVARFDGDVEVGADIFSRMSSLGGFSIGGHKKTAPQTTLRT